MVGDSSVLAQHKIALTGAVLLGATVFIDAARRLRSRQKPGETIPSVPGGWPFIGHFFTVMRYCQENTGMALSRWALDLERKSGLKIVNAMLMGFPFIIVSDPDLAEEVMNADVESFTKDFSDLPLGGDLLEVSFKDGLFFAATDNEKWQIPHRILKSAFSTRGIRGIMPMMSEQADKLVVALKRDVGYGGETFIDAWVTKMAFETIAVCGLGTSFGCFDDDSTHPFISALNEAIAAIDPLGRWPTFLRPVFCRDLLRKYMENSKKIRETCVEVIRKRRAAGKLEGKKDLLDMMLHDVDAKTGKSMTEEMIVDNVLTFLFAGQDSTAAAMSSCLSFLCANPSCKDRLLEEIDAVVGEGPLEWEHLIKLQYLDWCIKETLRLMPPATAILRSSAQEQLLGGKWRLWSGLPVVINIMSLHYSKELWGDDVDEFRPERWEQGQPHRFAFVPFATGPRQCIGREFTLVEQKITMVKLFQNFDFRPADNVKGGDDYALLDYKTANYPPFLNLETYIKRDSAFLGLFRSFQLQERARRAGQ